MKIFICVLGILPTLLLAQEEVGLLEKEKKILNECFTELGLTEKKIGDDVREINCFYACIIKKNGGLIGGKIRGIKDLEIFFGDSMEFSEIIRSKVTKITECARKANAKNDECDAIGYYMECSFEKIMSDKHYKE